MTAARRSLRVVTGGPGSGKTSLIQELRARGHVCSPESGRAIIREQLACNGTRLPWSDKNGFAHAMLRRDLAAYRAAAALPGPVFFDRGIPDVIGYLRLSGLAVPPRLARLALALPYDREVFVAPFWPDIYRRDSERRQLAAEAEKTCAVMIETYEALGYQAVLLPQASVKERADFILAFLAN